MCGEREKFIIRQPPIKEKDDYDSENFWISDGLPSSSRRKRRGDGRGEGWEWRANKKHRPSTHTQRELLGLAHFSARWTPLSRWPCTTRSRGFAVCIFRMCCWYVTCNGVTIRKSNGYAIWFSLVSSRTTRNLPSLKTKSAPTNEVKNILNKNLGLQSSGKTKKMTDHWSNVRTLFNEGNSKRSNNVELWKKCCICD